MQRIQCPNCKQEGVLQWKETITKAKGKMYHYKKLYVYHQHPQEHPERPKWCYLTAEHTRALGITENRSPITQNLTQTQNPVSSLFSRKEWTGGDLNPRPPECKSGVHTN